MSQDTAYSRLIENIELVLLGKHDAVEIVVSALLARGHVLMEDVPGVGKTMLARALARSIHADYGRVQCTPDLLPSDVTGVSVYNPKDMEFSFRKGPVFNQVLLADEINRATPRTQSALLEAMEERQVSVDGEPYPLPEPFFLIATQNPIEMAGTFPLPEAQLDRFMARISLGYPADAVEAEVMLAQREQHPLESLEAVITIDELKEAQQKSTKLFVHPSLVNYIQSIVAATRNHEHASYGSSPRGAVALMRASQALSLVRGEDFVTPDIVKQLAVAVLAHRIVINPRSRVQGITGERVVEDVLGSARVPVELEEAG